MRPIAGSRRPTWLMLISVNQTMPWVDGHSIGVDGLYTLLICKGILLHATGAWIETPQGVGVEFGEPERAVGIQDQVVWGAWNRQRLARVTGIGDREPGQRVELKATRCGEVVADIVGVLLSKPDGIVGSDLYPHHAVAPVWRGHLLEGLGARVKNGKVVPTHFPEPDPP